ncbi:MAG: prephenate dehydrogenase/arogenate dehydrogenase family protein [Planctomycetota bacterium]
MTTLGVVGCGAFSRFLLPHLAPHFDLIVWNRSPLPDGALPGEMAPASLADAAAADIVVISVPVQAFEAVLPQVAPHVRPGALVLDVASVKVRPVALLREHLPASCEILATHPLFGPESARDGLAGHTMVLAPVRTERLACVRTFLEETLGLVCLERTPEDHDREMAWVQGLPHFVVRAMNAIAPPDSPLATRAYGRLRQVQELLRHDSDALFQTIQCENPYAEEVRRRFREELDATERRLRGEAD